MSEYPTIWVACIGVGADDCPASTIATVEALCRDGWSLTPKGVLCSRCAPSRERELVRQLDNATRMVDAQTVVIGGLVTALLAHDDTVLGIWGIPSVKELVARVAALAARRAATGSSSSKVEHPDD